MTLVERLETGQAKFTVRERDIAHYLLEHYPQSVLQSASAIARATGISAATVVRFFAKLGYENFGAAQEEARRDVARKLNSPADRMGVVDDTGSSTGDFLARYHALEVDNLRSSFSQIDVGYFEGLIQQILDTKGRIYILGEKDSYAIAYFMFSHLNLCLGNVMLLETGQAMVADRLLWTGKNDLLICVSIRRYCPNGVRAAEHFRALEAPVITLTDSPLSPLMPLATHRLLVQTVSYSVFDSFTSLMSLAGAIVGVVARQRRQSMRNSLKRGQGMWDRFDTFTT